MAKVKLTQIRSDIKRPQRQKDTLKALGLGKINRSNILEKNDQLQGMINVVNHLITVEEIA
jgi:large subunit ribosomal protein L30